jgi:hypothetical protein
MEGRSEEGNGENKDDPSRALATSMGRPIRNKKAKEPVVVEAQSERVQSVVENYPP